ncbi:aromatic acid/H+ symport family MFS transporter [Amycolatopsis sp. OK19-0408]|uniref:Aromatic acid/H+ symport family MFS transporter n=1 Tax=Amycolatopsis iheyensis TaxID=2945988 RepID=A0A9X2NLJ5_9PSEU|nr:aromatic acid/H+ symport family MFS transporter [Amycolatopsis iheyensis]MCR6486990.1 aromatic acid/H+ symport family MFS transporter [Amycolatopsis iheyensis]
MSPGARSWVVPLAWTAVLLDGFDLVVLGSVLPVLLRDHVWGLTPASASVVSTVGLAGMTLGAVAIGTVTDLLGRRKSLILSVALFSVCTLLCAFAPSTFLFGLLRFVAGLGLGGCLPTAITLVTEYARSGKSGSATTTVMTGYHVGAVLTALLGLVLIAPLGWRAMFVAGALPAVVLIPLMLKFLPESEAFRRDRSAAQAVAGVFRGGLLRATIAFWVTSFMGLLLVYGLNTWLPEIMRQAGYPLGAALSLLLTLNLGGIAGLLLAGRVADRVGIRPSAIAWFCAGAVFLALLSVKLPAVGLYAAVFLTGCFVFSAQVLVYAYIGRVYPAAIRATGLGWAAGVGRIGAISGPLLGGALLTAGIAYPWGFYAFAAVGALGAAAVTVVRPGRQSPVDDVSPAPSAPAPPQPVPPRTPGPSAP